MLAFAYITNWKYDTQLYASVGTFGLTITLICMRNSLSFLRPKKALPKVTHLYTRMGVLGPCCPRHLLPVGKFKFQLSRKPIADKRFSFLTTHAPFAGRWHWVSSIIYLQKLLPVDLPIILFLTTQNTKRNKRAPMFGSSWSG